MRKASIAIVALSLALACSGKGGVFSSPVVRVDLRDKLPPKVRKLVSAIMPYQCKKTITVSGGDKAPKFVISWRAIEYQGSRYFTAVEVTPDGDGKIAGVDGPAASGVVSGLKNVGSADKVIGSLTVTTTWSGQKGCSKVTAKHDETLRADDDKLCIKPKQPKLLRPVK
ncbi:MAG: hypothetical protein KC503_04815 [Myxococcales bacterium]|nr:hypothetical protein [Myxococcales bacterium]